MGALMPPAVAPHAPKGAVYPGAHEAIISNELWNAAHAVLKGNTHARAGRTRTAAPALLRELIFTQTGAAMTPHHTKRKGKRYCYYTSMDVIRSRAKAELRGPQRLPAAMVEDAVIGEVRRMLRTPEVAARTARALKKERPDLDENTVVATLTDLAADEGVSDRYVSRLTRLAWLAPEVLERLVVHREPCAITIYELCLIASLPWGKQVEPVFA